MVSHPSTNRARRRVISLIETNALSLSQAATTAKLLLGALTVTATKSFVSMRTFVVCMYAHWPFSQTECCFCGRDTVLRRRRCHIDDNVALPRTLRTVCHCSLAGTLDVTRQS